MTSLFAYLIGIAAFVVALVQGALLPSLGRPLASVELSLILIVWLTANFRFREAAVAAITAGVTAGALSAMPFGTHLVAYAATAWVAYALFTRVFTNRSWPALLGLSAVTYTFFHLVLSLSRLVRAVLSGLPSSLAWAGATPGSATLALTAQLAAVIATMLAAALLHRLFGRGYGSR